MAQGDPLDVPQGLGGLLAAQLGAANQDLNLHARNGAQRMADGAGAFAEILRLDYVDGKRRVDYAQATGIRHVEESGSGRTRILDATTQGMAGSKTS